MRLRLPSQGFVLLGPALFLAGCHGTLWQRPVIWMDLPGTTGQQINGDFSMAFSTAESCEGLTLQTQGVPKSPRWVLHLASPSFAESDASTGPVQWTLAHAEDPSTNFQDRAANVDESARQVCALVKQKGKL